MKKIICRIFGHPDRKHYHDEESTLWCNGGCERVIEVFEIFPCPRCGYEIKLKDKQNNE